MIVAAGPVLDALPGGLLAASAVNGDGDGPALGAPWLLHATVYGDRGFKPCTVYGASEAN